MAEVEQTVLLLNKEENVPFVSEIDPGEDVFERPRSFRNIYEAKAPIVASGAIDDTAQVKEIRKIYKIDGVDSEDDDDEEDDQKVKALAKPAYSTAQNSENSPDVMKQKKAGAPDYLSSGARDMSPVASVRSSGYVCMPGSKGACETCPVYSLMAKPGVAERLNAIKTDDQFGNRSYAMPNSRPTRLLGAGSL